MTTVLQGTLGVEDVLAGKEVRDVTPGLQHLYKDLSPILNIMTRIPKGPTATNEKIEWTQKDLIPRWDTLTTSVATGSTATVIPTGDGTSKTAYFKTGDVVMVPNGTMSATVTNIGVVTTVTANTSIVITPIGWQSNLAATAKTFTATTAGDKIHVIADASEEYSQKPTPKVTKDAQEWNYIQFQRVPYIIGNINMDKKKYTGPERNERRDETHKDIRIQGEELTVWGDRYYRAGTNGRQFFMRGFHEYIRAGAGTNILTNWSAGLTESQLDEYLVNGPGNTGIGSKNKFWFMSNDLFLKVHELGKTAGRIREPATEKFGLMFVKYLAPNGVTYWMYQHHLFTEDHAGYGLIIDPMAARIRPYGTQGVLRLLTEIQENDRAGIADEWQLIMSLEVSRIEPHGYQTA